MKKLISMVLAVCMVLTLMPCAFAAEAQSAADKFTDVPSDAWYLKELDYAVYNGYISGTSATTFSPDGSLTRGQFVTILGRMLGVDTSKYTTTPFKDVDMKSWYGSYVEWARANGVVNGTSATTFAPNSNLTVEQMATIIANYINKNGLLLIWYTESGQYKDVSSTSGWAVANMEMMRMYGLLHTDANGNVNPRKDASRAEGAYTLVKFAKAIELGVEPVTAEKVLTDREADAKAKEAAQAIHDELWASGEITSSSSDKDKALAYWYWMCVNLTYRDSEVYPKRHTAYGALVEHYAVCDGFSYAYQMLLELEGIRCICIPNKRYTHMWTEAKLDGDWYKLDISHGVEQSKDPDGSFSELFYGWVRDRYFVAPISGPSVPVD